MLIFAACRKMDSGFRRNDGKGNANGLEQHDIVLLLRIMLLGLKADRLADELLELGDRGVLFFENAVDDFRRREHEELLRLELAHGARDLAEDLVGDGLGGLLRAAAAARGTRLAELTFEALGRALARHLDEAERAHRVHRRLRVVARQLRLRNLGGIIIIDFIDMVDEEHRRQVLRQLEKSLARDHAKATVYEMSPLGLVEMTRKRTTESLERQLCEACPACGGRGTIKTAETVTYEIFREITRAVRQFEAQKLLVLAAPKVVNRILEEESAAVAELEEFIGKTIRFQPEEHYSQEQYDVVLL